MDKLNQLRGHDLFRQIFKGGSVAFLLRCCGIPLALLIHVLLSRNMGVELYGQYSIIMGICLLLVLPVKLGFDFTALRFGAVYWTEKNRDLFRRLLTYTLNFMGVNLIMVSSILFVVAYYKPSLMFLDNIWMLICLIAIIFCIALNEVFSSFFRAIDEIFFSQFYDQVFRTALLLALIFGAISLGLRLDVFKAITATALAALISVIMLVLTFMRKAKPIFEGSQVDLQATKQPHTLKDTTTEKDWLTLSVPSFFIVAIQQFLAQGNVILLGVLSTTAASGQYAIAFRLALFVPFALTAVNAITAPMIAVAYKDENFEKLRQIVMINSRLGFLGALGVGLIFLVFGKYIISIFGDGFGPAYSALCILVVGEIIRASVGSVGFFLTMTGHQNVTLKIALLALIVNGVLAVLLMPQYGLVGAAIAACSGIVLLVTIQYFYIRIRLGIDTSILGLANTHKVKLINKTG